MDIITKGQVKNCGKSSIRLFNLVFDSEQEKDIYDRVEYLVKGKARVSFISNLIRVAFDSPRALKSREFKRHTGRKARCNGE